MWTFFAPTKAKIGASLIIVGAMWASESLALHLWTFLNADLFAEMGKRFAEQDPQQIGKMVQDMFSRGWFGGRRMMVPPSFNGSAELLSPTWQLASWSTPSARPTARNSPPGQMSRRANFNPRLAMAA